MYRKVLPLAVAAALAEWPGVVLAQPAAALTPAGAASAPQDDRDLPVQFEADKLSGRPDLETVLEGKVKIQRGGLQINADRVEYVVPQDLARATGNVRISRDGNVYSGPELQLKLQRYEGYFQNPSYYFVATQAGGEAQRIDFLDSHRSIAYGASYTSCPVDDDGTPAWVLTTGRVKLDLEANEGIAEGAVIRFYGVPILGAPVLSFPLTEERKSGWLPPIISLDSKSGLEFGVPYYWNIAPNRDATLTPVVFSRRGVGLDSEFRYLQPRWKGQLDLSLLPNDRVADRNRWAGLWKQDGELPNDAHYDWDWRRVSDDSYWKDFAGRMPSLMPRLLQSNAQVQRHWQHDFGDTTAYAAVRHWQVLQDADPASLIDPPYRREPQIGLRQRGEAAGWQWNWQTEFNRFTHEDPTRQHGDRMHLLASVARPLGERGWTLTPKLSLNAASYQVAQPLRLSPADTEGRRQASRVIPTASLDSGWVFERPARLFDRDVTQTLEPRLLYVNTPFRRQDHLPNFDSAANDFNITSVYTENAFSGVDRVSDAHQLAAGLTTRFLDTATGAETLRLGLVQRYLFRDQRVTPGDGEPFTRRFSDVLLLGSTSLVPNWNFDATVQYSPEIDRAVRSIVSARYSPGPFRTVSATYRYARDLSEQVELGWQWPIYGPGPSARPPLRSPPPSGDDAPTLLQRAAAAGGNTCQGTWYSVGRVNYSMKDSRVTDSLVGFEYDAGCWIGRVVATRLSTGRAEATTRLSFQLELVGLSRLNLGSNPLQVLKDNVPGYQLLRE